MVNAFNPLNGPKTHAIDIHFQAFLFDLVAVAGRLVIMNYELTTTVIADVILFTSLDAVSTDVCTITLRAFHRLILMTHTLIMQRQNGYVIQLVVAEDTIVTPTERILSKEWHRAAEVMKSTKLQASLVTRIIQSCPRIGAVKFLLGRPRSSNWENTFGLMGNGKVQPFTCREDGQTWGEKFCV